MLLRLPLRNPRVVWLLATLGICVAVTALIMAAAFVALPIRKLHDSTVRSVEQTYEVIGEIQGIVESATAAQAGQRGFLLTGDNTFLEPYNAAREAIQRHFAAVQDHTIDDPAQQRRLRLLRAQIDAELEVLAETIKLGRDGNRPGAVTLMGAGSRKLSMDAIRQNVAEMSSAEEQLLRNRRTKRGQSERRLAALFFALVTFGAVGVVASGCAAASAVLVAGARKQAAATAAERERLEAQLRELHKMQAVGRVTAGVAHDFNNLLQTLGGSLELLIAAVADRPDAVELGQVAQRATLRASELTSHLLSFSRQQVLLARPVSIDALFSGMEMLISDLLVVDVATRSELSMLPSAAGLAVQADPAQLEVALVNLALNARDAMISGGCLRISARAADADPAIVPPGRYTVITVADTGIGMDAATLAQACEPFFSTKGHAVTGLGLSMVQGFARQSGGEAHITSAVGQGTTIELWLPAADLPCEVEPAPTASKPMEQRILVVDDSQDSLVLAAAFLRLAGMAVTTAASGDLALAELARGNRFGAIVTDFAMTGMNGLELLTLAHGVDPAMVGMIITGLSDADIPAGLEGVVVLRKPFNRADLTQTVQRLIAVKSASRTQLTRLAPRRSGTG